LAASNFNIAHYQSEIQKLNNSMTETETGHIKEMKSIQAEVEKLVSKISDREKAQNEMREVINAKKNKYKRNCFEMVLQIQDLKNQIHENKIRTEMQLLTQEESPKFGKSHEKRGREKVRWAKR
jgi:hypothetical protein